MRTSPEVRIWNVGPAGGPSRGARFWAGYHMFLHIHYLLMIHYFYANFSLQSRLRDSPAR